MVMQSNNPKKICITHDQNPPNNNYYIFKGMRMHPGGHEVFLTFDPNGHRQSNPILKVCKATGIPIMVHANAKLPVK